MRGLENDLFFMLKLSVILKSKLISSPNTLENEFGVEYKHIDNAHMTINNHRAQSHQPTILIGAMNSNFF